MMPVLGWLRTRPGLTVLCLVAFVAGMASAAVLTAKVG